MLQGFLRHSFAVLGALLLLGSQWAFAGDAGRGERLSQQWCSNCHAADTAAQATDAAPSLNALAQKNKKDPAWVASWLANPHPPMPKLNLSHTDIDDIQAYLRSLAGEPGDKTSDGNRINTNF